MVSLKDALATSGIAKWQWKLIHKIAKDNLKIRDVGWAYLGGMKDVLWVLAQKDKPTYDALAERLPKLHKSEER